MYFNFVYQFYNLAMAERDSFGLTYSPSLHKSRLKEIEERQPQQQEEQLSPNKQTMLQTFRENILKPLESEVISSLTSVDKDNVSLPNVSKFSKKSQKDDEQDKENKHSLPSQKQIKVIASKIEEKREQSLSKSKIQVPRASVKEAISRKIEDAADFLGKGIEIQKFCFGRDKIQEVVLYFSEDMQFMGVYVPIQQRVDVVSMSNCIGVMVGLKTARFHDYLAQKVIIDEEKCFSLLFKERSYDFMTKFKDQRDQIVNDIKFLFKNPTD